ncbi:Uncharacterized protein TCM_012377 [Theobroma cacao]|uniref:Uncharacterized protein n=1 Tax=Theobroma cacao TaxID=3641 RepID=A0A061FU87_THECC|nr:Uncharacterized protein TCM_012377 [Theobroma cacao]
MAAGRLSDPPLTIPPVALSLQRHPRPSHNPTALENPQLPLPHGLPQAIQNMNQPPISPRTTKIHFCL